MMMSQIMMMFSRHQRHIKIKSGGFTLFELIIVLAIISAMVTIVLPYATRSNNDLNLRQECLNVAETIKYGIDLANNSKDLIRIVIRPDEKCYLLEIAKRSTPQNFEPVQTYQGKIRYFDQKFKILDIENFNTEGKGHYLIFDSKQPWPSGSFSLSSEDTIRTINIKGQRVEIEETTI